MSARGFNDSHMHLLNYGYTLSMAGLSEHTSSMREMLEHLRKFDGEERMRQADSSEQDWGQRWLLGRGWNQDYFTDEQRFPTRWDLDKVFDGSAGLCDPGLRSLLRGQFPWAGNHGSDRGYAAAGRRMF